jgi:hypothetical protein
VPVNAKNSALPVTVAASSAGLASTRRASRTESRVVRRPASSSGGRPRRITTAEASGASASVPSATRQLVAADNSATPTRPTSPPATSAAM